jgi:hypothetical protein
MSSGCGKGDAKPEAKPGSGEHHEMANMPPAVNAFHEVLAPLWHAPKGDQRMTDTCAAIAGLQSGAAAVGSAKLANAPALVDAVGGLAAVCSATPRDAAKFDAAFAKVHDAFHSLMGE